VFGGTGGPDDDDDDEARYALAADEDLARVVLEAARLEAANLDRVLRGMMSGGALIVRALRGVRLPLVRADLCTPYAVRLSGLVAAVEPGWWKGPEPRGAEFERWRDELALLAPIGFKPLPGVRYPARYRQARAGAVALAGVLGRVPGWWVIEPDCWADGTSVVRLTCTPGGASQLADALS